MDRTHLDVRVRVGVDRETHDHYDSIRTGNHVACYWALIDSGGLDR
jgi:hypothetical protein